MIEHIDGQAKAQVACVDFGSPEFCTQVGGVGDPNELATPTSNA